MTLRDTAIAAYEAETIAAEEAARIRDREEQERRWQKWVANAIATVDRQRWIANAAPDIRYDYDRQCVWLDGVPLRPVDLRHAGLSLVLLTQCSRCGGMYRTDEVFWPVESLSDLGAQLARQPDPDAALCNDCCDAATAAMFEQEQPA
jgi:hypothetical protein